MLQGPTESALIVRARGGDVAAFNELVAWYQGQAFNLALRMLGSVPRPEDVTQDAFFAAFRHLASFKGPSFRNWLLRIVANGCRDELRSDRRRPVDSLEQTLEVHPSAAPPDGAAGPAEVAESRELARLLEAGLASLPEDQRLVVVLADLQGFDYEEIARIARCPVGTVKSRLNRGRRRLRDYLRAQAELLPVRFRLPEEEGP